MASKLPTMPADLLEIRIQRYAASTDCDVASCRRDAAWRIETLYAVASGRRTFLCVPHGAAFLANMPEVLSKVDG